MNIILIIIVTILLLILNFGIGATVFDTCIRLIEGESPFKDIDTLEDVISKPEDIIPTCLVISMFTFLWPFFLIAVILFIVVKRIGKENYLNISEK